MQLLESAAFAAWPSASSDDFHGWQLRLDRGYTKRANSLNATERSRRLSEAEMDSIEERFRALGLTPTVRLPSFAPVAETDALLTRRAYRHCDPSLVMTRELSDADDFGPEPELADSAEPWLQAFQHVSGKSDADQAIHLDILQRIVHPTAWGLHAVDDSPRCCGLGVLVDQQLGVFDIATRTDHQRQGLAERLCRGLLAWGQRRGARTAFLQVVAENDAAVRLYEKLGFQVAYSYWYRVLDPS
jgi:GNAT superfamily N-acetyltransferase